MPDGGRRVPRVPQVRVCAGCVCSEAAHRGPGAREQGPQGLHRNPRMSVSCRSEIKSSPM